MIDSTRRRKRPLYELSYVLDVRELAGAGLSTWGVGDSAAVKLLGPRSRGIAVSTPIDYEIASVMSRIHRPWDGPPGGTLKIVGRFPGHAWVEQVETGDRPYPYWTLRCQGCGRRCRKLFQAVGWPEWRCRTCRPLQYADRNRSSTLLPRADADPMIALKRELDRVMAIRREVRRMAKTRPARSAVAT